MADKPTILGHAVDNLQSPVGTSEVRKANVDFGWAFEELLQWEHSKIIPVGNNTFHLESYGYRLRSTFHGLDQALNWKKILDQIVTIHATCMDQRRLWASCEFAIRNLVSQNEKPWLIIRNGGAFHTDDVLLDSAGLDALLSRAGKSIIKNRAGSGDIYSVFKQFMGDMRSVIQAKGFQEWSKNINVATIQ